MAEEPVTAIVSDQPVRASLSCTLERITCIRQHASAYVSIRQHTSAYVSIRQRITSLQGASRASPLAMSEKSFICELTRRPLPSDSTCPTPTPPLPQAPSPPAPRPPFSRGGARGCASEAREEEKEGREEALSRGARGAPREDREEEEDGARDEEVREEGVSEGVCVCVRVLGVSSGKSSSMSSWERRPRPTLHAAPAYVSIREHT